MYDVRSIDTRTCDTRAPGSCPVIGINSHVYLAALKMLKLRWGDCQLSSQPQTQIAGSRAQSRDRPGSPGLTRHETKKFRHTKLDPPLGRE